MCSPAGSRTATQRLSSVFEGREVRRQLRHQVWRDGILLRGVIERDHADVTVDGHSHFRHMLSVPSTSATPTGLCSPLLESGVGTSDRLMLQDNELGGWSIILQVRPMSSLNSSGYGGDSNIAARGT